MFKQICFGLALSLSAWAEPLMSDAVRLIINEWNSDIADEGPALHAFDLF